MQRTQKILSARKIDGTQTHTNSFMRTLIPRSLRKAFIPRGKRAISLNQKDYR